jgi:hypothetical protein
MMLFLLACAVPEPEPTACTPWLPYDVAGSGWSYVDAEGALLQTQTARGARDWEHGTAYAVEFEYSQDGAVVHRSTDYFTCEDEGLAVAGSESVDGDTRTVVFIDPPALWLPTELTVGTAWSNESEAVTETYDADGVQTDRAGGFVWFEAEVTEADEATVPAGTFASVSVLFGGEATMTFARDVGMVSLEQAGEKVTLGSYTAP